MKTILLKATGLLILGTIWTGLAADRPSDPENPGKYAIVFAIGDYPESTGWGKISAGNDVPLILSALRKQGFKEENIAVIRDSMATRDGISRAFEQHIFGRIKAGDIVFVHFSSHGQQVIDDNGDEIDGFDEAIIPYNANLDFVPGEYEGENHLRDDELGDIFGRIRKALGSKGNLLALIDACHSGTATRGLARARGTEKRMAPEGYKPEKKAPTRGQAFMEAGTADAAELAPMVTISGASADELNYETQDEQGNGVGSLSYAFSKVMSNATGQMTYRELFDRVKVEMQKRVPNQTPQIEGTIDQQLFGGAIVEAEPYFLPSYWEDAQTVYLESGSLQGLFDSSRVALFDLGAQDLAEADTVATGLVVDAGLTESYVVLDQELPEEMRNNLKVVMTGRNYSSMKVRIKLDLAMDESALVYIEQEIKASNTAELVDVNPELLITNQGVSRGSSVEVYTEYDQRLAAIDHGGSSHQALEKLADAMLRQIKVFAQTRFLRTLEMTDNRRAVSLEIVPLKGTISRGRFNLEREMSMDEVRDEDGNLVMEDGQVFKIRVTNNGYRKAYFTILDFTPDGDLSLVVPNPSSDMQAADYVLEGGQSIDLEQLFVIQEPYGNEMFKLIATEEPLDLSIVIDPIRGRATRAGVNAPDNPFQRLMENAASTTRAGTLSMGSASAHISTLSFKVLSKTQGN